MASLKTRTYVCSICALTMAASVVAGCGNGSTPEAGNAAQGSATPAASTAPSTPAAPLKISILANLQTPEVPSDKLEKLLEKATNADFEFQWVPDGSFDEKFQAALATGSLPQLAYLKNSASLALFRDAIKSGQFWEIGPLLKDYPNLSKLDQNILRNTSIEGKIYSLYQERQPARMGLIYRKDWADKVGLSAPKTIDEIYNMAKKFKEADLAGEGKTIPISDRNDLFYGSFKTFSMFYGTPNGWGEQNGKLVPEFMTKGYMDTLKLFKKMRDEGLINQDFPVTSKTDAQNLVYTGRSGMYVGTLGEVKSFFDKTTKNVPDAQFAVTNEIQGPDGKLVTWGLGGFSTVVLFPKTAIKTEAELKAILGVMDKFYSPEVANLLKYGSQELGHYTLKDGKVVPSTDAKLKEKDVRPYLNIALYDTTNITPSFYEMPEHERANNLINAAVKFMVMDPTIALDSKTFNEKGARLQEQINDATYQFILGKIDEAGFQAAIKKWQNDGGQQMTNEFNEQYAKVKK
jgi:putative aldouronate transport system substrate-binding protein